MGRYLTLNGEADYNNPVIVLCLGADETPLRLEQFKKIIRSDKFKELVSEVLNDN